MRLFTALSLIAAIALIVSCQQPAQSKARMEKQADQIKTLENKVDALNNKLEQFIKDFNQHLDNFHKKSRQQKKLPAMG